MADESVKAATSLTIGQAFSPRHNSLNFLRLFMALMVIASHALVSGPFGNDQIFSDKTTIGTVAVFGFFGISGYLIAGSAAHNSLGRYLWQRFLRIFPAFWVCLVVTVVFFGSIGWISAHHLPHCGISCYLQHRGLSFVTHNFFLRITQTSLGHGNPVNNAPLWTLFYEFLCYLLLGGLAVLGLLKRRWVVVALAMMLWLAELVVAVRPHGYISLDESSILMLGPVFLTGTLLYLFRDEIRDSRLLALGCAAGFVASMWVPIGGQLIFERPTSVDLLAPLVAYPLLWLGIHLPLQRVGATNDYSYGVYIYGAPVLSLLEEWRVEYWGYVPFLLIAVGAAFCFAAASWWLVERHALKLKKIDPRLIVRALFPGWGRTSPAAEETGLASPVAGRSASVS